jgi:5-methylcytosine-specific restriction endonuclease McrBC regulatory subunit McrC
VKGGIVVQPRFGWSGIGRVLSETGWHASPEFLTLPMVPGSGREVPPWVLAGPVLARLRELLRSSRRGYREAEALLQAPRGRILWPRYCTESLVRGRWHHLPCRFPDLDTDPRLRRAIRWTLERLHHDLVRVGATDRTAVELAQLAIRLIELVSDVTPEMPRGAAFDAAFRRSALVDIVLQQGLQAMGWVAEERGLGGGRELDGLAWQLPLDRLWEHYVEGLVRREAAQTGGQVRAGRLGQTLIPLHWSDPVHRSLGHLMPDVVVQRARSVHVVDAKYKAHLAELDEVGWRKFIDEHRDSHRADLHQVLAYASLFDADDIRATLVYPLRAETWEHLHDRDRDVSIADIYAGGRHVRLELRGVPFGAVN